MVSTHNTCNLPQPLEKNLCVPTPISLPEQGSGSLKQFPNPNGEQTIKEPSSVPKGIKVLKNICSIIAFIT